MPKFVGDITNVAGGLLSVFDAVLPLQENWSIHDAAAGTNAKVYKCDGDILFYVYVGDNQTNYGLIRLWATWDNITHKGSGSQTANISFCKSRSAYNIYINGNRFIYINLDSSKSNGHYCGLIKRIDTSKKLVLVVGGAANWAYQEYNFLSGFGDATDTKALLMEDVDGNASVSVYPMINSNSRIHDLDGKIRINETPLCHKTVNPRYFIGWYDGVVCLLNMPTGWHAGTGDRITVNGMDWISYNENISIAYAQNRCLVRVED